jgi:sigma54-dependent transcription regulator
MKRAETVSWKVGVWAELGLGVPRGEGDVSRVFGERVRVRVTRTRTSDEGLLEGGHGLKVGDEVGDFGFGQGVE